MKVTKKSPHSGNINTMEIPVTDKQLETWQSGTLIQNAMPNLTPDQREFLMTGLTPEDWTEMFGEGE